MSTEKRERIEFLVKFLNKCCDEYYNGNSPTLSDAQYDELFDELTSLELETGIVLSDSPTQRAGYEAISELSKVEHKIQLLSLAKTKNVNDVVDMLRKNDGYLSLKLDGLTVQLDYIDGILVEASTRGDGMVGEVITHNAKVFANIPLKIPYKEPLTVSGEAIIDIPTFNEINNNIDNDEDKYSTPRNLASGSVRQLDSRICKERGVKFYPFNVLVGFDDIKLKSKRLNELVSFGFDSNFHELLNTNDSFEVVHDKIYSLKNLAEKYGLPIDGIVFSYDNVDFAKAQGKTSHHFKDGIAFKFGDPTFESVLRNITWNISRTGQLTPIAEFDTVEIDNTNVERASLHNITFIENLKLIPGDRILVSKRNMIIPHIEANLDIDNDNSREDYQVHYPKFCPICNCETVVKTTELSGRNVSVLYCVNKKCPGKQIKRFTHFVSKPALNIDGLSEATLEKFISFGWLKELGDIFSLEKYRDEIINLDGFGEKSYNNLISAINTARETKLSNYLVAMNISLVGKTAAADISAVFGGDVDKLLNAIEARFDFSSIEGFGTIMNEEIYKWFDNTENLIEFIKIAQLLSFENEQQITVDESNIFFNKTVVITGTFELYSRDELTEKLKLLGAKVTTSVSKKTDFVLCGENAGSKLSKANDLNIRVITEDEVKNLV